MRADQPVRFNAARLFDGTDWHEQASLLVAGGVLTEGGIESDFRTIDLGDGIITPGLVDLQCNGGGGVLLDGATEITGLRTILDTHARLGTLAMLPTLITASEAATDNVIALGAHAVRMGLPGFLGLHLEGPHLSLARRGAHDPALIRQMGDTDVVRLERARALLPNLVVTVAAETVAPEVIARLVRAGVVVSIGHSDATYDQALAAFRAGASMATHLFNAMSQLGNREPGLVGAVLDTGSVWAGVIADGIHIHPATLRTALAAKRRPGGLFLVSDSMAQAGTDWMQFRFGQQTIYRANGALRLTDGTLAGADLTQLRAAASWHAMAMGTLEDAVERGTSGPLNALGINDTLMLKPGAPADFVVVDSALRLRSVYRGGVRIDRADTLDE